jgi:hypothetical protein
MGQQQLLLLVIAVVLVGLAVLAGFEILQRHYRQDEADGLLDRSLTIATHAVSWKSRNDPFEGGNQSYAPLSTNGIALLGLDSTTVRGEFGITAATANTLEVTGVSTRPGYEAIGVRVYVSGYDVDSSRVSFIGEFSL